MSTITASQEQAAVEAVPKQLFIGGEWLDAVDGATMPVDDPATGEIVCHVADAGPKDALLAEAAAVQAQEEWAATAPRARSEILRRAYEIILSRADELATLMTLEMGKPLAESKAEITYAAEFLRWFSEEAVRIEGRFGTDFTNPDFVRLADAFGLPGWRIEAVDDFGPTLRRALDLDVPSLIVLPIDYSLDVAISEELGTETVAA